MIAFIHEVENIAEQYGLQITGLDVTDVTLMVRLEVMPSVFIHVYRNLKKNKLNMALVLTMFKRRLPSILFLIVTLQLTLSQNAFAYLDPGTGSYIFQVLVATIIGGLFTIKMHWQKIKNFFGNLISRKPEK